MRRIARLAEIQRHVGCGMGGEPGARLAKRLAMPVSGDTLLRLVRAADGLLRRRTLLCQGGAYRRRTAEFGERLDPPGSGGVLPPSMKGALGVAPFIVDLSRFTGAVRAVPRPEDA